jgi:hypothetical protein
MCQARPQYRNTLLPNLMASLMNTQRAFRLRLGMPSPHTTVEAKHMVAGRTKEASVMLLSLRLSGWAWVSIAAPSQSTLRNASLPTYSYVVSLRSPVDLPDIFWKYIACQVYSLTALLPQDGHPPWSQYSAHRTMGSP